MARLISHLLNNKQACADLIQKTSRFVTNEDYKKYFVESDQNSSIDEIQLEENTEHLETATEITETHFEEIKNVLIANKTEEAFDLAELKMLRIHGNVINALATIKEVKLGMKPSTELDEIRDNFNKNVEESLEDLTDHIQNVLKFDDLLIKISDSIGHIGYVQTNFPVQSPFSFVK